MDTQKCADHIGDPVLDTLAVLQDEWSEVRARREAQHIIDRHEYDEARDARADGTPGPKHSPRNTVGLALSGGGIRSATFNLGVLQALHDARLLRIFDYLSTVSGGGFIGGWWSAWLSRSRTLHNPADGPRPLFPSDEDLELKRYRKPADPNATVAADPIHHVRLFANYLTPRMGLMSPDVWRAAVIITRNIGLTWLVLLPLLFIAVLLAQATVVALMPVLTSSNDVVTTFYSTAPASWPVLSARLAAAIVPAVAVFGWFVFLSLVWLMLHRGNSQFQQAVALVAVGVVTAFAWQLLAFRAATPFLAWIAGALALTVYGLWQSFADRSGRPSSFIYERLRNRVTGVQGTLLAMSVGLAVVFVAAAIGHEIVKYAISLGDGWREQVAGWSGRVGGAMATIGAVHTWLVGAPKGGAENRDAGPRSKASRMLLAMAPALVVAALLALAAYLVNVAVTAIIRGDAAVTIDRLFYRTTLVGIGLTIVLAVSESRSTLSSWWWWVPIAVATAVTAISESRPEPWWLWVALAISAASAAAFVYKLRSKVAFPTKGRSDYLLTAASVALLLMCALHIGFRDDNIRVLLRLLLGASAFLATMMVALGWSVDPNNLSLHMFYKARLVRAYIGASNPRRGRDDEDVTTSQDGDNVALRDLAPCTSGVPYHLVNTTLNLAAGDDVTVAQRRAANFVLSRLHCGSSRTGFRPTECYMGGDLSLGTAVAVSGAAASPNMGSQSPSTAVAMLMALLNVRLGFWAPTPHQSDWQAPQARLWPFYLIREFFSRTTDQRAYCYLTDGGHFDNTGLYSLVERGCRYIVVADCGADPDGVFDDLSNAVRRCRIDFHAEITLPGVDVISRKSEEAKRRAYIIGTLKYSHLHLEALGWTKKQIIADKLDEGVIVVVKPNLIATMALDARRYGQLSANFPQETTGDQWYDEAQFESYRALGYLSVRTLLEGNAAVPGLVRNDGKGTITTDDIGALFQPIQPAGAHDVLRV